MKRVKSPTVVSNPDYNNYCSSQCERCMIDSGSDVTLVSVDSSYYMGKLRSLNTYRGDVLLSCAPVARVRLLVADFDMKYLGKKTLGKWLLGDPPNPENTVRQTHAQASTEAEQELSDHTDQELYLMFFLLRTKSLRTHLFMPLLLLNVLNPCLCHSD